MYTLDKYELMSAIDAGKPVHLVNFEETVRAIYAEPSLLKDVGEIKLFDNYRGIITAVVFSVTEYGQIVGSIGCSTIEGRPLKTNTRLALDLGPQSRLFHTIEIEFDGVLHAVESLISVKTPKPGYFCGWLRKRACHPFTDFKGLTRDKVNDDFRVMKHRRTIHKMALLDDAGESYLITNMGWVSHIDGDVETTLGVFPLIKGVVNGLVK